MVAVWQGGIDACQWSKKIFRFIRDYFLSVLPVAFSIAIGAYYDVIDLWRNNIDDVFDQRFVFVFEQAFVDTADACTSATGEDDATDFFICFSYRHG